MHLLLSYFNYYKIKPSVINTCYCRNFPPQPQFLLTLKL